MLGVNQLFLFIYSFISDLLEYENVRNLLDLNSINVIVEVYPKLYKHINLTTLAKFIESRPELVTGVTGYSYPNVRKFNIDLFKNEIFISHLNKK